jgi:hypothetical protein
VRGDYIPLGLQLSRSLQRCSVVAAFHPVSQSPGRNPMNATDLLGMIEVDAERAIPQQLDAMIADVNLMRPALEGEEAEYADALLLKLNQLIGNQQLAPLVGAAPDTGTVVSCVPSDSSDVGEILQELRPAA